MPSFHFRQAIGLLLRVARPKFVPWVLREKWAQMPYQTWALCTCKPSSHGLGTGKTNQLRCDILLMTHGGIGSYEVTRLDRRGSRCSTAT
jgi:hypothetical protein